MAINAGDLDGRINDALKTYNEGSYKNEKDSPKHLKVIGDEMKKYFEENTEITYGWAAVLPPPASTPDPVVQFGSSVMFPVFDLTAAGDLASLALLVQTSVLGGIISHAEGFAVPPGTFLMKSPLVFPPAADAASALFSCIVSPTCAWVLTLANPAPLPGTHGTFTGATVVMAVM